jgi:hypothetical protein
VPDTYPQWDDRHEDSEREQVRRWRYREARHVGLTPKESRRFARGDGDTGALRVAAEHGATHEQLVHIFL